MKTALRSLFDSIRCPSRLDAAAFFLSIAAFSASAFDLHAGAVTEALVKEAQGLGLKVVPWTVNNPADLERLIGWGVDGLITDYPDRLREVMRKRNLALPRPVPAAS